MENREKELARNITDAVNCFGFDYKAFCEAMIGEHRTLQQTFTNICLAWLRYLSECEDWHFDGRNVQSREIATKIASRVELHKLPMI